MGKFQRQNQACVYPAQSEGHCSEYAGTAEVRDVAVLLARPEPV